MNVTVEDAEARVPVTIVRLDGDLDASNYEALIDKGAELYGGGCRNMLLDMRGVPYMGSSGLVAVHSIALILAGQQAPNPEDGWDAHHAISRSVEGGQQSHLKVLVGPEPDSAVRRVFERTGMDRFIPILTDEPAAGAAF